MVSSLGSLADSIRNVRAEREKYSAKLAVGGKEAPWSDKTTTQIDINITTTNKIQRLESIGNDNKLIESRLKTQLSVLDDFMKLAQTIQTEFMPGSYTLGGVRPGLASTQSNIKNSFHTFGNRIDLVSGEYAMGGVATQNKPIKEVSDFAAYTGSPADYSNAVSGNINVYINDDGVTTCLSGSDFDTEISSLYKAIMELSNSTTGADAHSDQASAYAATAQKLLLTKYYDKLEELNSVMDQEDQLSDKIQEALNLRAEFTEDSVEGLLAQVTSLSVMEEIRQHLFTQESRKAQDAADMLKQG